MLDFFNWLSIVIKQSYSINFYFYVNIKALIFSNLNQVSQTTSKLILFATLLSQIRKYFFNNYDFDNFYDRMLSLYHVILSSTSLLLLMS